MSIGIGHTHNGILYGISDIMYVYNRSIFFFLAYKALLLILLLFTLMAPWLIFTDLAMVVMDCPSPALPATVVEVAVAVAVAVADAVTLVPVSLVVSVLVAAVELGSMVVVSSMNLSAFNVHLAAVSTMRAVTMVPVHSVGHECIAWYVRMLTMFTSAAGNVDRNVDSSGTTIQVRRLQRRRTVPSSACHMRAGADMRTSGGTFAGRAAAAERSIRYCYYLLFCPSSRRRRRVKQNRPRAAMFAANSNIIIIVIVIC